VPTGVGTGATGEAGCHRGVSNVSWAFASYVAALDAEEAAAAGVAALSPSAIAA
jgi:hypothetical protein